MRAILRNNFVVSKHLILVNGEKEGVVEGFAVGDSKEGFNVGFCEGIAVEG